MKPRKSLKRQHDDVYTACDAVDIPESHHQHPVDVVTNSPYSPSLRTTEKFLDACKRKDLGIVSTFAEHDDLVPFLANPKNFAGVFDLLFRTTTRDETTDANDALYCEIVDKLLRNRRLDDAARAENITTPLHYACMYGTAELARICLTHCPDDINVQDTKGKTPFYYAVDAAQCNTHLVSMLLSHGADVNIPDNDKRGPVHIVCRRGQINLMNMFITERGANSMCVEKNRINVNATDDEGITPLAIAAAKNDTILLNILLGAGADANRRYGTRMTAIGELYNVPDVDYARGAHIECLNILLNAGASPDACDRYGSSLIEFACKSLNLPMVTLLLSRGADPNGSYQHLHTRCIFSDLLDAVIVHGRSQPSRFSSAKNVDVKKVCADITTVLVRAGAGVTTFGSNPIHDIGVVTNNPAITDWITHVRECHYEVYPTSLSVLDKRRETRNIELDVMRVQYGAILNKYSHKTFTESLEQYVDPGKIDAMWETFTRDIPPSYSSCANMPVIDMIVDAMKERMPARGEKDVYTVTEMHLKCCSDMVKKFTD